MFPEHSPELATRVEFLGMAMAIAMGPLVSLQLYPKEFNRRICQIFCWLALFWVGIILLTSTAVYARFLPFYQLETILLSMYVCYGTYRAWRHGRDGAGLFLSGFLLFFLSTFHAILNAQGIIQGQEFVQVGLFAFLFFQALILALRFDRAFDKAELAETEIRQLNANLESTVEERTEKIRIILSHVKSGFFLLDRQGTILPGFSNSCRKLLDPDFAPGANLYSLLGDLGYTSRHLRISIDQIFDSAIPTAVALEQLPNRLDFGDRSVSLSGSEIRAPGEGSIVALLITMNDATILRDAEQKIASNEMVLTILKNLESFRLFCIDFAEEMAAAESAALAGEEIQVRMLLHTIKGNLGTFRIFSISEMVHNLENKAKIQKSDISEISLAMNNLLVDHRQLFEIDSTQSLAKNQWVSVDEIQAILDYIDKLLESPMKETVISRISPLMLPTISMFLGPVQETVQDTASGLDKEVKLTIEGQELRVPWHYKPVLVNIIHLVRNSVAHGIELPEDRGHKPRRGSIHLRFQLDSNGLTIRIEDDGQGLDISKIRSKALQKGLFSAEQLNSMPEDEIAQLIFLAEFSTETNLTEFSGRGIGMTAIADSVHRLGGSIQLSSKTGTGSVFVLNLPELNQTQRNMRAS